MPLVIGTRLGSYEIIAPIGSGGMGEVYRAHDTTLGRDVAIKILPAAFTTDPGRLARFEREAHVLAALNHPHIATIYGVDESNGVRALVMELIDGPTLAERLALGSGLRASGLPKGERDSVSGQEPGASSLKPDGRRGLPVAEALQIARQIADALDAAHEKGIVHRDLKPANVKVTRDGVVKVLDFGLAKTGVGRAAEDGLSDVSTITMGGTKEGAVLGTAAYMSPEQARGQLMDKRTDISAFGCVLYEMLTGAPAFARSTVTDTLAAIVDHDVKWADLPPATPAPVVKLLHRCLAKDRRQRLSDIADVRLELDDALTSPLADAVVSHAGVSPGNARRVIGLVAGASLVISALTGIGVRLATRPAAPRVTRMAIVPPASAPLRGVGITREFAISPDGRRVVYVSANNALVVRALDELAPITLAGPSIPESPIFSPDGQWIAFKDSDGGLKKMPAAGGPVVTLLSNTGGTDRGVCWSPDGPIVFATGDSTTGLLRVPVVGGEPEVLTTPDRAAGELDHLYPEALPGGAGVLFTIPTTTGGTEKSQIAVLDLRTRTRRVLLRGGSHAQYVAGGYLIYGSATGTVRAVRFDPRRLEVVGAPVPVVEGVAVTGAGTVEASIAADGTLVYRPAQATPRQTLVWVDRKGREEPVGAPPRAYIDWPRLSPDGKRIAAPSADRENDIWLWDLDQRRETRFTFDPAADIFPVWTPDGQRLVWASGRDGALNVYMQAADGTGTVERLTASPYFQRPTSFTPDGTRLVLMVDRPGRPMGLAMLDLSTRTVTPLADPGVQSNYGDFQSQGEVSPDGRWLAYASYETGRLEVFVRPFPGVEAGKWQVSTGGGQRPRWARDSHELFYRTSDGAVMGMRWDSTGGRFHAGPVAKVVEGRRPIPGGFSDYDVTPDGARFLMIKNAGDESTAVADVFVVVQNWVEELKRLLPR